MDWLPLESVWFSYSLGPTLERRGSEIRFYKNEIRFIIHLDESIIVETFKCDHKIRKQNPNKNQSDK